MFGSICVACKKVGLITDLCAVLTVVAKCIAVFVIRSCDDDPHMLNELPPMVSKH